MDALEKCFKDTGNFVFKDREALQLCKALADEHNLKASDLAKQYDVYASCKDASFDVSASHVAAFSNFLKKELAAEPPKQAAANKARMKTPRDDAAADHPTPKRLAGTTMKENQTTPGAPRAAAAATPPNAAGERSPLQITPGTATKFATRQNKGQVVTSYNGSLELPASAGRQSGAARALPPLQLLGEQLVEPGVRFLHMVDPLEGRVHAVNERILQFGDALRRVLPDEAADVNRTSVAEVTQEPVWVAGRVVPEAASGAMNAASVLLEGSREGSGGARVRLDLSGLERFRLFPGQAVCVRGLNPTGHAFVAQQLVTHIPPAAAKAPAPAATEAPSEGPTPAAAHEGLLSMVVAAGPFTTSDNVLYEPLDELLKFCTERDVHQLLLIGPFVDSEHPSIKDGSLNVPFEQLFRSEVLRRLALWQQEPANQARRVLLQPSVRDVTAQPVFPQPPFSLEAERLPERLRSVQSPCSFLSGEGGALSVAACSQDLLLHLTSAEVAHCPGQDRMTALASHVVGQQSAYPLFPPPLGACLDTSHYGALRLPATPDLLVLPSNLAPFAKLLQLGPDQLQGAPLVAMPGVPEASVIVNPGRLAKGPSGGTFAHVQVVPAAPAAGGESSSRSGGRHQRIRVDILRL